MRNARSTKNDYTRIMIKGIISRIPVGTTFDSCNIARAISTPRRTVKPRTVGNLLREIDGVVLIETAYTWKKIKEENENV